MKKQAKAPKKGPQKEMPPTPGRPISQRKRMAGYG
jgi:hypothetical protein